MKKDKKPIKKKQTKVVAKAKSAKKVAVKAASKPKPEVKTKKAKGKIKPVAKLAAKVAPKVSKKEKVEKPKPEVVVSQAVAEEKPVAEKIVAAEPEVIVKPQENLPAGEAGKETVTFKNYAEATGRRKTSVARVRLVEGKGVFLVNGKEMLDYFSGDKNFVRMLLDRPFSALGRRNKFDVMVKVNGGGIQSQIGAVTHGISRALVEFNPEFRPSLRKAGFLTRDSRMKERRKYGLMGARKKKASPKR